MFKINRNTVLLKFFLLLFGLQFVVSSSNLLPSPKQKVAELESLTSITFSNRGYYKQSISQAIDNLEFSFEIEEELLEVAKKKRIITSTLQEYYTFLLPKEYNTHCNTFFDVNLRASSIPLYLKNEVFRL